MKQHKVIFPSVNQQQRHYRREWEYVMKLAKEEWLFAPDEVLFELERGGDDLYQWARGLDFMFLEPIEEMQVVVSEIVERFPTFVPEVSSDGIWADP